MTLKAYLDNIHSKTGKTPEDFHSLAQSEGLLAAGTTATQFTGWLKTSHGLGHGHAMAIYKVFKDRGWIVAAAKPSSRTKAGTT